MKSVEEERDALLKGLQAVEAAEAWYRDQLASVQVIYGVLQMVYGHTVYGNPKIWKQPVNQSGKKATKSTQRNQT